MKIILVPTDFSAPARNATAYASALASALNAQIKLLNAHMEPVPGGEGYLNSPGISPVLQKELESLIYKEVTSLEAKYEIDVSGDAVIGFTGDSIAQAAEEIGADLIVMGREAKKRNMIFGNTILKTIRKTTTPVLVIPESVNYTAPKRITLAVDFKEMIYTKNILPLQSLVKNFNAALTVLHIEQVGKEEKMDAAEISGKLHLGIVLSAVSYYYEHAENENIEQGILNFLQRHPADMLVMISHHHNFLERLFGSSHTTDLIFDTNLPLLLLKN
ncbi:MAG: universal stress protein [Flavisolibacter sp.]